MRKLDGKFRIDGEKILNPAGVEIPDDEPLFLLRARDRIALTAIRFYLLISTVQGCNEYHLAGCRDAVARFEQFIQDHPERMKEPGITRGK